MGEINFQEFIFSAAGLWLCVTILFGVIEAFTLGLTTIWFCGGSLVAMVFAMLGLPVSLQIIVFIVVSGALLYFTRPLAAKKLNQKAEKTNVEALIGAVGTVTMDVKPYGTGRADIQGKDWTVVSRDEKAEIPQGTRVKVLEIQGVKAVVEKED